MSKQIAQTKTVHFEVKCGGVLERSELKRVHPVKPKVINHVLILST